MVAAEGAGGSSLQQLRQWQWHPQQIAAKVGAGNGGRSGGSARADNNQLKSGTKDVQNITFRGRQQWP